MADKIEVLDHGFVRLVDSMGSDLSVARAARVSYDAAWRAGEDQGSDAKLIRYLWKHKHTTPFEAVTFTWEIKAPIFVFRQWHRHRTWCLSADSLISFEMPNRIRRGIRCAKKLRLDELYRQWTDDPPVQRLDKQKRPLREFRRARIRAMLLRVYDEQTQQFTVGHIADVVASGVKQVFEITLADGKKLKCSKDHRLLTSDGWQRLEEAVGLVLHGKTAAMTKIASVLTNGYSDGDTPWNKGLTGYKNKPYRYSADGKQRIVAARSGERSNFWKGGMAPERAKIGAWTTRMAAAVHAKFNYTCQSCGKRGGRLQAHHKKSVVDHPECAYDFDNLETRCQPCHHREHGKTGEIRRAKGVTLRAMASKIISVRYVGEEPTYDISVEGPHHNFVANGMIVHNSFNELSARYRELPEEFYVPRSNQIGTQSKDNKQMRDINGGKQNVEAAALIHHACDQAFLAYRELLADGVPRELARTVLPLATYSHMFATVNLLNLLKFLTLRSDAHAQMEIRVYAEAMCQLAQKIVPVCIGAWQDNR